MATKVCMSHDSLEFDQEILDHIVRCFEIYNTGIPDSIGFYYEDEDFLECSNYRVLTRLISNTKYQMEETLKEFKEIINERN